MRFPKLLSTTRSKSEWPVTNCGAFFANNATSSEYVRRPVPLRIDIIYWRVKMIGQKLCRALKISGPFNIHFICKDNEVKVIECNLRASRSMPFISKTYNTNFIELATRGMLSVPALRATVQPIDVEYVASKVSCFGGCVFRWLFQLLWNY